MIKGDFFATNSAVIKFRPDPARKRDLVIATRANREPTPGDPEVEGFSNHQLNRSDHRAETQMDPVEVTSESDSVRVDQNRQGANINCSSAAVMSPDTIDRNCWR